MTSNDSSNPTRRDFVKTTALAVGAAALPFRGMSATASATARWRRYNVRDPRGKQMLESYRKAIRAMMALPPDDPRNWYRIALVHTIDCPHGNWWFLVWHRGFIGWFERICRELSGDPNFALPYWDWTENPDPGQPFRPGVPDFMFDDILTPTNPAFIPTYADFYKQYGTVIAQADYWKFPPANFDPSSQYGQLLTRGVRFPADLWFDINDDPRGLMFFELGKARGLTREKPWFDAKTAKSVTLSTILDALSPRDFITFASPKTMSHSGLTGFGILEGQPHNRVHNCIGGIFTDSSGTTDSGGFMQANLSPVDPIFYLHHANIDRLWDAWTRKQQARGYPILPDGYLTPRPNPAPPFTDYELWSSEPFVFFIDEKGQPAARKTAGDYAAIGDFDYDYQPGSGEEVVAQMAAAKGKMLAAPHLRQFNVAMSAHEATHEKAAAGRVTIPEATLEQTGRTETLLAKITLALPPSGHGDFKVVVNASGDPAAVDPSSPSFAGTLSMFGHHTVHCPVTFTVPLTTPVARLRSVHQLRANAPLNIQVVPDATPMHHGMLRATRTVPTAAAEVLSIVVEEQCMRHEA